MYIFLICFSGGYVMSENNQFSWIEFYEEFADILLDYKERRQELINKIKQIYANTVIKMPTLEPV